MLSESEWMESVKKKIKFMSNQVWNGLNWSDIEIFLNNFKKEDEVVGWVLLDMLIYYSSEQEQSLISNLMRLLKRDIWMNTGMAKQNLSSQSISLELQEIYKKMCLIPVDDSDPSASAFSLTPQFKKSEDVPKTIKFIDLYDLPLMLALKYQYFVFYDDLIGTGHQFSTFWNEKRFGKNHKIKIKDLAEKNPNAVFYYLALGGCEKGVELLKSEIPNLKLIVSEYFPKCYDVFCDKNEYWELNPDKKDIVLAYIRNKEKELNSRSRFSENLSVLFQHGRASNTVLSLYWYNKSGDWEKLYKR